MIWLIIVQNCLRSAYELNYPDVNPLAKNDYFYSFNPSIALYNGKLLKMWRVDNRQVMFDRKWLCWLPGHAYHIYKSGYIIPFTQNYVALQYEPSSPIILTLPIIPGMAKDVVWWKQYEDPRVFVHTKSNRVFFTATVYCDNYMRIALVELDPKTWQTKNAFILDDPDIVGSTSAQKNWNLFENSLRDCFILTDAYPYLKIYSINLDNGNMLLYSENNTSSLLSKYDSIMHIRCSTTMIPYSSKSFICALHLRHKTNHFQDFIKKYSYRTIFIEVSQDNFKLIRASPLLTFTNDSNRIEFASGLSWDETQTYLILGLGIDDRKHKYIYLNPDPNEIFYPSSSSKLFSIMNDMIDNKNNINYY